jgi:hypothetical protein
MASADQYTESATPRNFNDTAPGEERRLVRSLVRKAKSMTKMEREILLWLIERWFYHRKGAGVIHPGVAAIRKATEWCERSVRYVLKRLRDWGFIVAVEYAKGGRRATRYMVDSAKIIETLGNIPPTVEGHLVPLSGDEKPCMGCRRNNYRQDLPKPAEWAEWLKSRFQDGLRLGLSRRIDPVGWLNGRKAQAKARKSQSLAWEAPF